VTGPLCLFEHPSESVSAEPRGDEGERAVRARMFPRETAERSAGATSLRTGIDLGAAREKVRTARVLVGLPETSASMSRGELSFSQVRALSRVATEANEGDLLKLARGSTTAQLERKVRSFRRGSRADEAELLRHRDRSGQPRPGWLHPRRGTENSHYPPVSPPRLGGPRPGVPFPRLWTPLR